MSKLLITGGSGLVGYALQKIYPEGIYLSSSDYNLTKEDEVKAMFNRYRPEGVIHLAAKVGGIINNIEHQVEFFDQNILINTFVIHYAYEFGVKVELDKTFINASPAPNPTLFTKATWKFKRLVRTLR